MAGYGLLHVGIDVGGSIRFPVWAVAFGLKPSLGQVPILAGRSHGRFGTRR